QLVAVRQQKQDYAHSTGCCPVCDRALCVVMGRAGAVVRCGGGCADSVFPNHPWMANAQKDVPATPPAAAAEQPQPWDQPFPQNVNATTPEGWEVTEAGFAPVPHTGHGRS